MDKGNAIMSKVAENCVEYLEWGASLNREHRKAAQSTLGHHSAVLGFVLNNLQRFEQKELFNKYFDLYSHKNVLLDFEEIFFVLSVLLILLNKLLLLNLNLLMVLPYLVYF